LIKLLQNSVNYLLLGSVLLVSTTIANAQGRLEGDVAGCDAAEFGSARSGALSVETIYTGEVFSNVRGGISSKDATRYLGLLDLGITMDLEALELSLPGKCFLLAQNTHGEGLTEEFIGDTQVISNIDASRNIMQVSEYWWEFSSLCDHITVRLGKQEFNTEFAFMATAEDFIHSTFGLTPSTAFPTYPNPSMGAVAMMQLNDKWTLKTGIWDAFSSGSSWGFSGNDSILIAGELECTYSIGAERLPGILAVGAIYEDGGLIDGQPVSAVHEYIVQCEQVVYRANDGLDSNQGLSVFVGYYPRFTGEQTIDKSIGDSMVAGLVYDGPFDGRDHDSLGIGLAWAELFREGKNEESAVELYYVAQVKPGVRIQPDLQYITTPSGIFRDALAVGIRLRVHW